MSRWRAAALHLLISAAITLFAAIVLFAAWRPWEYFLAAGVDDPLLVLVAVQLTLGPLLTAAVFRAGKRGLLFDLIVIGLLQTLAFAYGASVAARARPIFLVAVPDRFVLVSASEIDDASLAAGGEQLFRSRSWTGPRLVAAVIPQDPKERSDLAFSALSGRDLQNLPKYYREYDSVTASLLARAMSLDQLIAKHPEAKDMISDWRARSGRGADAVKWLPLTARKTDLVMLLEAHTGRVLQSLPIDPW